MRRRKKMSRKGSRKLFSRTAVRKHKKNRWRNLQRGGVAL